MRIFPAIFLSEVLFDEMPRTRRLCIHPIFTRILHIGNVALELFDQHIGGIQHREHGFTTRSRRFDDRALELFASRQKPCMPFARAHQLRSRQRRDVDDEIGRIMRARIRNPIAQYEPTFGIGIVDFNRQTRVQRNDIVGA